MPVQQKKKSQPPERDYSHRSLFEKLGVKPGQRIAVLGLNDEDFLKGLGRRADEIAQGQPKKDSDLIFFAAEDRNALARLEKLREFLRPEGAIWIVYPKGQTHIRETDVIAAGKAAGFVDNKVCRFSETHTALRLVIPLAKR